MACSTCRSGYDDDVDDPSVNKAFIGRAVQSPKLERKTYGFCHDVNLANLCCVFCTVLTAIISIYTILLVAGLIALPNGTKIQLRFKDHLVQSSSYSSYVAQTTLRPGTVASNDFVFNAYGKHLPAGQTPVLVGTVAANDMTNLQDGETAVTLQFDCAADFAIWERAWSPKKKTYCCKTEHKGCVQRASVAFAKTAEQLQSCSSTCFFLNRPLSCQTRILEVARSIYGSERPKEACENSFKHVLDKYQCSNCKACMATDCLLDLSKEEARKRMAIHGQAPIHT